MKTEIKTQKEANEVHEFLIKTTMKVHGIEREQAEKRIKRLFESDELRGLTPDMVMFQIIVDRYMATPVK